MPACCIGRGVLMKKRIYALGVVLCSVMMLASGFRFSRGYSNKVNSEKAFHELAATVEVQAGEVMQQSAFDRYSEAYERNGDLVGWIYIEGTNINYPVMQTVSRPNYYLKRNFEHQYSDYGVPYVAENCEVDISDNIIIYAHNMKNGTMFSNLLLYEKEDFYTEHRFIQFDTLADYGTYEIVAVFRTVVSPRDGFRFNHFVSAESKVQFDEFIAACKGLSLYETGVSAVYGDSLITLSTCEYTQADGRIVVVAKKIANK